MFSSQGNLKWHVFPAEMWSCKLSEAELVGLQVMCSSMLTVAASCIEALSGARLRNLTVARVCHEEGGGVSGS